MLQTRKKWQYSDGELKENDIVLITENNLARNKWPLGRVIEIIAGGDGLSRTARIQTTNSVATRPFQRLHLFEKYVPSQVESNLMSTSAKDSNLQSSIMPIEVQEIQESNDNDVEVELEQSNGLREMESSQGGENVPKPYVNKYGRVCKVKRYEDYVN